MTMEAEGIKALVGLQLEKAHRFLAQADEMYSMQYWDLAANRYYLDESGEVHLSEVIRKIQIPSEKWDEQGGNINKRTATAERLQLLRYGGN